MEKEKQDYSHMSIKERLFEIKKDIELVTKTKEGYNFQYEDPEQIVQEVIKQLEEKGIDHHMSIHVPTQYEKDAEQLIQIVEVNKQGKEKIQFVSRFRIDHTYVIKDTDESITFIGIGSGKADQPGQADGAAWSYARRQEYEKRFAINIDKSKNEELNTELKYVPNADGEAVEILKPTSFTSITTIIQQKLGITSREDMVAKVDIILGKLNKEKGTKYKKLNSIPEEYAEDVIKIISLMVHTNA